MKIGATVVALVMVLVAAVVVRGEVRRTTQPTEAPALTELQKSQLQNAVQRIQIAQLQVQVAQAELQKAATEGQAMFAAVRVDGYELDLQAMTYHKVAKPEKK